MKELVGEHYLAPVGNKNVLGKKYKDHKLLVRWKAGQSAIKSSEVGYMKDGNFVVIEDAEKLIADEKTRQEKAIKVTKKPAAKKKTVKKRVSKKK